MPRLFVAPSKYVQGAGELANLTAHIANLGTRAFLVASPDDRSRVAPAIDACGDAIVYGGFVSECSRSEIDRLCAEVERLGCDVVIGLGGGKAIDTAKAVAHFARASCLIVPTVASTDAPCSGSAVIYTAQGAYESYLHVRRNPDLVLVDTAVIAKAPVRFLVAGMGDAMSTWFEARACQRASGGGTATAAMAIARQCYETLIADSLDAKAACEAGVVSQALDNVVEANILLSGMGFENGGLAAAHAIHNGLTRLDETRRSLHGEKVAFGTIVQLVLENAPAAELNGVIAYFKSVGLPTRLSDLGIETADPRRLMDVATAAVAPGEPIHNMPFPVTAPDVHAAILAADRLGD